MRNKTDTKNATTPSSQSSLTAQELGVLAAWFPPSLFDLDKLISRFGVTTLLASAVRSTLVMSELNVEFDYDTNAIGPVREDRAAVINELLGFLNCEPIDWSGAAASPSKETQSEASDV